MPLLTIRFLLLLCFPHKKGGHPPHLVHCFARLTLHKLLRDIHDCFTLIAFQGMNVRVNVYNIRSTDICKNTCVPGCRCLEIGAVNCQTTAVRQVQNQCIAEVFDL